MPFQSKTYSCGSLGKVRRLDNLNHGQANWINIPVTQAAANGIGLLDIQTAPNNGDHVFTIGPSAGLSASPQFFGVAVSNDGGTTWNIPGGNYQAAAGLSIDNGLLFQWNEVVVVGPQVYGVSGFSVIVGTVNSIDYYGTIAVSNDGGATYNTILWYNNLLSGPNPPMADKDCTAVHFPTINVGVVALHSPGSLEAWVIKTNDGGGTWTILNGQNFLTTAQSPNPPATTLPIAAITGISILGNQEHIIGVGQNFIVETIPVSGGSPTAGVAADSWKNNFLTSANIFPNNTPPVYSGFTPLLPIGWHLGTFQSPDERVIWVSGDSELGVHSINHGESSYTITPGPGWGTGFSRKAAHFYKNNLPNDLPLEGFYNQSTVGVNQVYWNSEGFSPSFAVLSDDLPGLVYSPEAIWTWYEETPELPCYKLENCLNSAQVLYTQSTCLNGQPLGYTVQLAAPYNGVCWKIVDPLGECINPIEVTCLGFNIDCMSGDCNPTPTSCYLLTDCTNETITHLTSSDLSSYIGEVITVQEYVGCFIVSQVPCGPVLEPTVTLIQSFGSSAAGGCEACAPKCYILSDCEGVVPSMIVNDDLSTFVGQIINILGSTTCWQVSLSDSCSGSITVGIPTAAFATCLDCNPVCYLLVNCKDPNDYRITSTDLSLYIHQVIYIEGCPGVCWQVNTSLDCTGSIPVVFQQAFVDCETCSPTPPPPPLELRTRSVKPGYTTPGCDSAYTEKVSCNFGSAVYDQMVILRYGITMCCNLPVDKWDIKMQLLQLAAIYDPELCNNAFEKCCAPCGMIASLTVYYPVLPICPAPTNMIAVLTIPPNPCPEPTNIQGSIVVNPTQPCVCYLIIPTNPSATCVFEYTNCFAVPQIVEIFGPTYVCSIISPTTLCDPSQYTLQTTPDNCANGQCGSPLVPCICYTIEIPFDGFPHVIETTNCSGTPIVENLFGGTYYRCSQINPLVDPGVTVASTTLDCGLGECHA